MARITDPRRIEHEQLRECAIQAAWVALLEESVEELEDLVDLLPPEYDDEGALIEELEGWQREPLRIVFDFMWVEHQDADRELEGTVRKWLALDPEHWPIFRLVVLEPWRKKSGHLRADAPRWVHTLVTNTVSAHMHGDLYGRRFVVDPRALGFDFGPGGEPAP